MKDLKSILKESIFDDADTIIKHGLEEYYIDIISKGKDFNTDYKINKLTKENTFYKDGVMGISCKNIKQVHPIPLTKYFPGVHSLLCEYYTSERVDKINQNTFIKNIECPCCEFLHIKEVSDINININTTNVVDKLKRTPHTIKLLFGNYFNKLVMNNVNIQWDNSIPEKHRTIRLVDMPFMPKFNNVTGNSENIYFYSVTLFDEDPDKLFSIFEWPNDVSIKDLKNNTDTIISVKNLKKAKALVNNRKRYIINSPLLKLKSNAKFSDIIDISKMKNFKNATFADNNVKLAFDKNPQTINPNYQKTADGYYVYLGKTL